MSPSSNREAGVSATADGEVRVAADEGLLQTEAGIAGEVGVYCYADG